MATNTTLFPTRKILCPQILLFLAVQFVTFFATPTQAQLQQSFVYTSGGAIATRNDQSGAVTPVSGSPLLPLGFPVVIDAKARFLFAAGNNSIHMYRVDAFTGIYSEVSNSPFASANTKSPILIATEPTGTYLGVVNSIGINPGESSVESFKIDSAGQALLPVSGSFLELVSSPIGAAGNPALGTFYVFLGPNQSSSNPFIQQDGELLSYTIDPLTGFLGNQTGTGNSAAGRSFGADPLGRFVVAGDGKLAGSLQVTSAGGGQGVLPLSSSVFPREIFVAPGQHFIYVTISTGGVNAVHIYTVDTTTWQLTESSSSPLPNFTSMGNFVADPTGPFVYQSTATNQLHVYLVDSVTGYFSEIASSPFTAPGFGSPVAFRVVRGPVQPAVGPVASLSPSTLFLGGIQVGTPGSAQTVTLSNTGDQALSINGITVSGANVAEFSESNNCSVPTVLPPAHSCAIYVVFTPSASGARVAQLNVTDNAPGSPQSVPLTGTGTPLPAPAPAITFVPGTLNFPSLSVGASSATMNVTVTNSGNAPLTISSILLNGNNPADFSSPSGNCLNGSIAANASCILSESFTPFAAGLRQATLTFTDNSTPSPQIVALNGTGIASPSVGPAIRITPTTVSFATTTQGLASVPVSVTITNSGNAPLHISSIVAGGNNPAEFTNAFTVCSTATIAAGAACIMNLTFAPVFSGPRSETLTISDDAPNSPHVLNVFANAPAAFALTSPAAALSASVTAGQTATYNLQFTPGLEFTGNISLACTGAPLGASCTVPTAVTLNIAAPASVTVTVPTSNGSIAPPNAIPYSTRPHQPQSLQRFFPTTILCLFILLLWKRIHTATTHNVAANLPSSPWKAIYAVAALAIFVPIIFSAAGCGGSSPSTTPAPHGSSVVTPRGTSTLVLTPSAVNAAGKPLQLSPIQLTLTVN